MATAQAGERAQIAELLSEQAAGLLAGQDRTAELLSVTAGPERAELAGLMHLARRLHTAMPPVAPRAGFTAELMTQLTLARPEAEATRLREKEQRRRWVAGIGGAVALLGLGLVTYRTAQAVTSKVGPWAKSRADAGALAAEQLSV
jgi:hypothetical protein